MSESLKNLALFVTVVEHGGFANSADELGITPSAVSKSIGRLEERLGTRLFTRSTRSIKLTEPGHEL
ncbi:MAG: LysR family transcriptional regulator, partial [Pseudomonadales bacterium]